MKPFAAIVRSTISGFCLAAVLAVPAAAACDSACAAEPGVEVITRADLLDHGVARLSDVFAFSSRWHASSIDGYHWQTAPHGVASGRERWAVYVDDVPVAPRLLGRNQLNAVPVPAYDVECVELVAGPDLRQLTFSQSGSIHIHTRAPDFGLTAEGSIAAGNEINDPGPFRYTDVGGENVDRIGPIGTGGLSVNTLRWTGRATARSDEFHVTDAGILDRLIQLYTIDPKPRINVTSAGLTAAVGSAARRHRFLAGLTDTEDLAFIAPVGVEIPAMHRFGIVGGSGRITLQGGTLRYAASYARGDYGARSIGQAIGLDWRQHQFAVDAEANLSGARIGGGIQAVEPLTGGDTPPSRILTTRLFGGMSLEMLPGWNQHVILEWKQRGEKGSGAGYASTDVRIGPDHRIVLSGSYGTVLPDPGDLWMWIGRGYTLPTVDSVASIPPQSASLPRLMTADASWIGNVAAGLQVSAWSFYRRIEEEYLPYPAVVYRPESHGFGVHTSLLSQTGSTAGAGLMVALDRGSFRHRFQYVAESVLGGAHVYRDRQARVPAQRMTYSATIAPVERMHLSALLRYTAATSWPEYEEASGQSGGAYPWELPEYFLLDVSASKRMWKDHLLLSVTLKNVLNEPVRYHPAGAVFHMALHFALRVNITSEEGF